MKAAVVTKDHRVSIEEKRLRELKPGEALVKTEYCGVCLSLIHISEPTRLIIRSRMPSSA